MKEYGLYKSEVARVAGGGTPVIPAGVLGVMRVCHRQVLRYVHIESRSMDEDRCFHAFRKLAGLNGGARYVQRVEGKPR